MLKWLKEKIMCDDCGKIIRKLAPNHKRCKRCAYKIVKIRSTDFVECHAEDNRRRAREWYIKNREYKIKQVLKYQRKKYGTKPISPKVSTRNKKAK